MSKISLASNASGTGIFTLSSPATNTNRTLTLPDSTGTLLDTNGGTITGTLTVTGVTTLGNGAVLGVPTSGTITNLTGLPLTTGVTGTLPVANGGTGITSFGSGIATFLGTPSSANLAAAVTDETGSGALVFATSPTLVTPALGTPSSGTVTNLTGTAAININGTVGATTATTGAFTSVNTSGIITTTIPGTGIPTNLAVNTTAGAANGMSIEARADESQGIRLVQTSTTYNTAPTNPDSPPNIASAGTLVSGRGGGLNIVGANGPVRTYSGGASTATTSVSSTGLAVTGTLSATGTTTIGPGATLVTINTGASPMLNLLGSPGGTFSLFQRNDEAGYGGRVGAGNTLYGPGAARSLGLDGFSEVSIGVAGTRYVVLTSTGLAVTGALIATQNSNGVAGAFENSDTTNGYGVYIHAGGTAATRYSLVVRNAAGTQDWFKVSSVTGEVGSSIFAPGAPGSPVVATISTAGLAVTGTLSSTLGATIQGLTVGLGAGAVAGNTAVGYQAGVANTTGSQHVFIGYQAGSSSVGATNVTAVGYQAASGATGSGITAIGTSAAQNSTGDDNIAVGAAALLTTGSGANNTAVGRSALRFNSTASNNTAVGYEAARTYSNGGGAIVAIGRQAGYTTNAAYGVYVGQTAGYSSTGVNVTHVGFQAGYHTSTGVDNTSLGWSALQGTASTSTGSYNTALGSQALYSNTTASNNTAVGYQAGYTSTVSANSVVLGYQAGFTNTQGSSNTLLGYQAGYLMNPASAINTINTFVGYGAGYSVTTGTKNTVLGGYSGNQGGLDIRGSNNFIVLSDGDGNPRAWIGAGNSNDLFRVGSVSTDTSSFMHQFLYNQNSRYAMNIGNTTTLGNANGLIIDYPNSTGTGSSDNFLYCGIATGVRVLFKNDGGLSNYSANNVNISDRREKTNFTPAKNYLNIICAIPVQTFNYIDQDMEDDDGLTLGVVAQDVQAVAPELVTESNWGTKEEPKMRLSIYQTDLQYALMKCIQEQQVLIAQLQADVAALQAK